MSSVAATEGGTPTLSAKTAPARTNEAARREGICDAALVEQWAPVAHPAGGQDKSQ